MKPTTLEHFLEKLTPTEARHILDTAPLVNPDYLEKYKPTEYYKLKAAMIVASRFNEGAKNAKTK